MIYVMHILYYIWYCHNGPNRSVDVMSYRSSNVARPVTIPTGFAQFCRGYYQIVIRSSLLTIITQSILILTILSTQQSHKYAIDLGVGHHRGVEAHPPLTSHHSLSMQFQYWNGSPRVQSVRVSVEHLSVVDQIGTQ